MNPPSTGTQPVASSSSTMKCVYCTTQLSFPADSIYIQCPKCNNTMNPQAPSTNYITCVSCNTLLSHPPSSLVIQCPKCLQRMQLPLRVNIAPTSTEPDSKANRKKRKTAGGAAKRPANAYMLFCKERRVRLRQEMPEVPFGQLGAKLGEIWRGMSNEEKRPYEERAAAERSRQKEENTTTKPMGSALKSASASPPVRPPAPMPPPRPNAPVQSPLHTMVTSGSLNQFAPSQPHPPHFQQQPQPPLQQKPQPPTPLSKQTSAGLPSPSASASSQPQSQASAVPLPPAQHPPSQDSAMGSSAPPPSGPTAPPSQPGPSA